MKIIYTWLLALSITTATAQQTPFERGSGNTTTTYAELIPYYEKLAASYPGQARLLRGGLTDAGKPLHLLILSADGSFDPQKIRAAGKCILLVNNGIHPGEPEGIDASMMFARDLLKDKKIPANTVICIIPAYNIDGMLNRSSTSRANQNGPAAYGFRGNARNYDLNRDFIKTDSRNSESFQQIFNTWQPHIFVDTHTSNGADYQYTMTLIPAQKDKLQPLLSAYLQKTMLPELYGKMQSKGYPLVPYVNSVAETPDQGITGFMESPRYSTGYAALHNCIGFMPETHMLKPYSQRVDATRKLLETYVEVISKDVKTIVANKMAADRAVAAQQEFVLDWKLDQSRSAEITFKGYEARYKPSEVSGKDRLYYDRNRPYTRNIKEWNHFIPAMSVQKPAAYIIPQAYEKVIALLKLNNVKLKRLDRDITVEMELYTIGDYKTAARPYEGHYLHSAVQLKPATVTMNFYAGDYVAETNQASNRYLVETLEPQAADSYFNWNFFDAVLGQKEHFSAYVFEDTAAALLKNDAALRKKLSDKKAADPAFAQNAAAQLDFVYKNSDYYEKTHLRYPIGRLASAAYLSLR
ncbi:M14 family metallopeptidase [Pedobacter sp. SYP-B3415]|uniref:M14 family metallopeptidase n=1 Tax=Pedobacter sp. SYP-B3415 TaxID=2496641 RepID=UPI00101DBB90|nr:M14 family metallopeptidase [Pedobacter sp. SYP-B3415]